MQTCDITSQQLSKTGSEKTKEMENTNPYPQQHSSDIFSFVSPLE